MGNGRKESNLMSLGGRLFLHLYMGVKNGFGSG